jgi:GNAT superfamily N-acetyltransferase
MSPQGGQVIDELLDRKYVPDGYSGFSSTIFFEMMKMLFRSDTMRRDYRVIDLFSGWGQRHYVLNVMGIKHLNVDTNPDLEYPHYVIDFANSVPTANDILFASPPYNDEEKYHTPESDILSRLLRYLSGLRNPAIVVLNDSIQYNQTFEILKKLCFARIKVIGRKFDYFIRIPFSIGDIIREDFYLALPCVVKQYGFNRSAQKLDQFIPKDVPIFEVGAGPGGLLFMRGRDQRCIDYAYSGERSLPSHFTTVVSDLKGISDGNFFDVGNLIELKYRLTTLPVNTYVVVDLSNKYEKNLSHLCAQHFFLSLFILSQGQSLILKVGLTQPRFFSTFKPLFSRFFFAKPDNLNARSIEIYLIARNLLYDIPLQFFYPILNPMRSPKLLFGDILEQTESMGMIPPLYSYTERIFSNEPGSYARKGIKLNETLVDAKPIYALDGGVRFIYQVEYWHNCPLFHLIGATYRGIVKEEGDVKMSGKSDFSIEQREYVETLVQDKSLLDSIRLYLFYLRVPRGCKDLVALDFDKMDKELILVEMNAKLSKDDMGPIYTSKGWATRTREQWLNVDFEIVGYMNSSLLKWMFNISHGIVAAIDNEMSVSLSTWTQAVNVNSEFFDEKAYVNSELKYQACLGHNLVGFGGIHSVKDELIVSIYLLPEYRGKKLAVPILNTVRELLGHEFSLYVNERNIKMIKLCERYVRVSKLGEIVKFVVS